MTDLARGRFFKKDGALITRTIKLQHVNAAVTATLPRYGSIRRIYLYNAGTVGATGIIVGTAVAGAEILAATALPAKGLVDAPALITALTQNQKTLYIGGTFPANTDVFVAIEYVEVDPTL